MNYNSTLMGRGAQSTLVLLVLLCGLLPFQLRAVSPLLGSGEFSVVQIDWTAAAPGIGEFHRATFAPLFRQANRSASASFAPCFTGFEAGPDTTYCPGQQAVLDGGYISYDSPGNPVSDLYGVQWTIVEGSGTLTSGLFGGGATVEGINFATSFNAGAGPGMPVVRYNPAPNDTLVVLRLMATSQNGQCDSDMDEVTLFYDRFQAAVLSVDVDGTEVVDSASTVAPSMVSLCSGSTIDVDVLNNTGLLNGQQDGAVPKFNVVVTAPAGLTGLPVSGVYSPNAFNQAFNQRVLTNGTGAPLQASVRVTTFYERMGSNQTTGVDLNECEGAPVIVNFTVLPAPQATAGFEGFMGTQGVVYCDSDTAQIRVTGSPNSRVIYQIDYGTGVYAPQDTVLLGPSGTNGATPGNAADFVEIVLDTLTGEEVNFRIILAEFIVDPSCSAVKNFEITFNVLDSPSGELTLAVPADSTFCNTDLPAMLDFVFTTTDPGSFTVDIARAINGQRDDTTAYPVTTMMTGVDTASGSIIIALPGDSIRGQVITYNVIGITEITTGVSCPSVVAGANITITEQPEAYLLIDLFAGADSTRLDATVNPVITICDESLFRFVLPDSAFATSPDGARPYQVELVITGDTYNVFGTSADTFLLDPSVDIPGFSTIVDIPNNLPLQTIGLEFIPYYDQNSNDTLGMGDCVGDAVALTLNIAPALEADFTSAPPAFPTVIANNDSTRVCEGEDVVFTIFANQQSTANVVETGGPNRTVAINTAVSGGFTGTVSLSNVTAQTALTLIDVRSNTSGCTQEFNQTITVYVDSLPEATIAIADEDICNGGSSVLTLIGTDGEGDSLKYAFTLTGPNGTFTYDTTSLRTVSYAADRFDFSMPGQYVFILDSVVNNNTLRCTTAYPSSGNGVVSDTVVVEFEPAISLSSDPLATGDVAVRNVNSGQPAILTDIVGNEICNRDTFRLMGTALSPDSSTATMDSLYYALEVVRDNSGTLVPGTRFFGNVSEFSPTVPFFEQHFVNTSNSAQEVIFRAVGFYFDDLGGTVQPTANDVAASCLGDTLNFGFLVLPTPLGTIGSNQVVCYNTAATIDVTGTAGADVFIQVLSGDPNDGNLFQGPDMTEVVTLGNDGKAFITTGLLTDTLVLRKYRVENVQGCADTSILDVTIAVVPQGDAEFTNASAMTCEASTATLSVTGSPNAFVYYSFMNNTAFLDSIQLDAMGTGSIITGSLTQDTVVVIESIVQVNFDASNTAVRCVNTPLSQMTSVTVTVEAAPNGTITATPVCNGTEQPELTFNLTAGNTTSGALFDLVINGVTYNNIASGNLFEVDPDSLVVDSIYVLTSITEVTSGALGCASLMDTVSFDTVKVEAIPAVTATLVLGSETFTVDSTMVFRDTVCSGTTFSMSVVGTPTTSLAGDPLWYNIDLSDPENLLGLGSSVNASLPASQLNGFLASANSTLNAPLNMDAPISATITPFYGPGPIGSSNTCPGQPIVFEGLVRGALNAAFDTMLSDAIVCEDSTAVIVFTGGSPNIKVTLVDDQNFQSVDVFLDASGSGTYVTPALNVTTTYGISSLTTTTQDPFCTVLLDPSLNLFTVNVLPTPSAAVTIMPDTVCAGDQTTYTIMGTANTTVTYRVNGDTLTTTLNGSGTSAALTVFTSDSSRLAGFDTIVVYLDTIEYTSGIGCPTPISETDTLIVRPIPNGTITAGAPVCFGESVPVIFTSTTPIYNDYRLRVRLQGAATTTLYDGVRSGDTVFMASTAGVYELELIRDNRGTPGSLRCSRDSVSAPGFIDTANVIIEQEIDLKAAITGGVPNRFIDNGGFGPIYRATVCNGSLINTSFSSTTGTSQLGDALMVEINVSSNPGNLLGSFLAASPAALAGLNFTEQLVNTTGAPQLLAFTLKPFFANPDCEGQLLTFEITVLPALTAEVSVSPATVCAGDNADFVITGPAGAKVTYSSVGFTNLSTGMVTIPAAGQIVVTGMGAIAAPTNYLEISSVTLVSSPVNTSCTTALFDTAFVTVNPLPTGDLVVSDNGPICNGDTVIVSFETSFGMAGEAFTVYAGATSYTVTPVTTGMSMTRSAELFRISLTQDSTFSIDSIRYVSTGCLNSLTGSALTETVEVNELPEGTVTAKDMAGTMVMTTVMNTSETITVCTGDSLTLTAAMTNAALSGSNYVSVAYDGDANYFGLTGATGTVAIPVDDFDETFSARFQNLSNVVAEVELKVTYYIETGMSPGLGAGECAGRTDTLLIQVLPNPIAQNVSMTICSDEVLNYDLDQAITNGVTGTEYTYTTVSTNPAVISFPNRNVASVANITAAEDVLTNTTGSNITVTFLVTPSFGGCEGNDFFFTLIVAPEPVITAGLDETVCSDEDIAIELSLSSDPDAINATGLLPTYNIVSITPSVPFSATFIANVNNAPTGPTTDVSAIENDAYTNFTGADQTVTYQVVAISSRGCVSDTVDIVATIQPEPYLASVVKDTVCSGVRLDVNIISQLTLNNLPGATVNFQRSRIAGVSNFFVYDENDALVFFGPLSGNQIGSDNNVTIGDSLINGTTTPIILSYDIDVTDAEGCETNSFAYEVLVVPTIQATLTANGNSNLCSGESVSLSTSILGGAGSTNTVYTYSVLSADAGVQVTLTGNGPNATVRSAATSGPGNATIQVLVNDPATGCSASATEQVVINQSPLPKTIVGAEEPCAGNAFVSTYAIPTTPGSSYQWSLSNPGAGTFANGNTTSNLVEITWSSVGGPYTLTVVETNANSSCSVTNTKQIRVVQSPSADFSFTIDPANPFTVNFMEAAAGSIAPNSYLWSFGDPNGSTSTMEDPSFTYPTAGTYMVTLEAFSLCNNNTVSITKSVIVGPNPNCQVLELRGGTNNFISLYVDPANNNLTDIFGPFPQVTQVNTIQGGLPQLWLPSFGNASDLTSFSPGVGYFVRADAPATVQICGTLLNGPISNSLNGGVNYVGSANDAPVPANDYLCNLVTQGKLRIAYDFEGLTGLQTYLPSFVNCSTVPTGNGNDLQNLTPGAGVIVVLNSPAGAGTYREVSENHEWVYGSVSGIDFDDETLIEVIDNNGSVIGEFFVDADGSFRPLALIGEVSRVDGSFVGGLIEGEAYSFRYKDMILKDAVTFDGGFAAKQIHLTFDQLSSNSDIDGMVEEISVFPVPVTGITTIEVSLAKTATYGIDVLDITGRTVARLLSGEPLAAGNYRYDWNVNDLPDGMYTIIIRRDGAVLPGLTTKVVK